VLVTTTPALDGLRITRYLGVVGGEAILGANAVQDMFAGIRDLVGGRSAAYEQQLRRAKQIAFDEMEHWAGLMGANAIVGVHIDYETIGGSMLMVSVSGTAVRYEDPDAPADDQLDDFGLHLGPGQRARGREPGPGREGLAGGLA
jgi:uncharacterized protein YbjQ (UPF0145 family)